jgi:hypothetical protein
MTNVVTLELTGDETSLEKAIESATRQAQTFDQTVSTVATSVETSSDKMEHMAGRADHVAQSTGTLSGALGAMASGLVLLGINSDSLTAKIVGGLAVGFATVQGVADVARLAMESQRVAIVATKVATLAGAAATGVATAAQWAFNLAMAVGLGPILLIVAGVALLVGIIVLIATKTTWFQTVWRVAWDGIKAAAGAVKDFFVNVVWHDGIERSFNLMVAGIGTVQGWFASIGTKIRSVFGGMFGIITSPFRAAFNFVSDAWNNTIGRLSWTVPSWVPLIGGNTISAPRLPHFHSGGMVTGGVEGAEVLGVLRVGERVQTREQQAAESRGGNTYHITVNGNKFRDGTDFEQWLDELRNDGRGGGGVGD